MMVWVVAFVFVMFIGVLAYCGLDAVRSVNRKAP